ncbi:unnamed protein product [marine sediment metagenome]|uniref:Uncharacterized protein n=1 Tax=marine sediment metagenome TaxID=412755 RepID=X1TUS2_9ZZZZ
MKITPQRAELIMEAAQLREFGWTQQQIADALKVRQYTISRWFKKWHNGTSDDEHKTGRNMQNDRYDTMHTEPPPIRLFPCLYEDVADRIPSGSIDLILTDPPSSMRLAGRTK